MKIGDVDNHIILYFEGIEDIGAFKRLVENAEGEEGLVKELLIALHRINVVPTIGQYQDETDSDDELVPGYRTQNYNKLIARFSREYIQERKAQGEEHGTKEQREYAARSVAYQRAGRPENLDWTQPDSIEIPEEVKKQFGLDRFD